MQTFPRPIADSRIHPADGRILHTTPVPGSWSQPCALSPWGAAGAGKGTDRTGTSNPSSQQIASSQTTKSKPTRK